MGLLGINVTGIQLNATLISVMGVKSSFSGANPMMRPSISAPGLAWKPRKSGWEARWQARTDLVERGFKPKSMRIWFGTTPKEIEIAFIEERCRQLQDEMLVWARGGIPREV